MNWIKNLELFDNLDEFYLNKTNFIKKFFYKMRIKEEEKDKKKLMRDA